MNNKIISLQCENVKRLKAITITPEGNMVVIGGRNAQGKSSAIDSIEYGLRGGKAMPQKPLREGEEKGYIVIETPDLIINRTFTPTGSNLVVRNRNNGLKINSPQAILDKMSGDLTFDPLAFSRMDAKKQKDVLQRLLGLDFTPLNAKRDAMFQNRTIVGREEKSLEARFVLAPRYTECTVKEEESASGLVAELDKMRKFNEGIEKMKTQHSELEEKINDNHNSIDAIKEQIAELEDKIVELGKEITKDSSEMAEIDKEIKIMKPADTSEIEAKLSSIDSVNAMVRANKQYDLLDSEFKAKHAEVESLTEAIAKIDQEKADMIANAKTPIEGMAFTDEGVTYKGIPFSQCSSAEQLKVSVAMGAALAPELKVMLIRDGSLLDKDSMIAVKEMADKYGLQLWIEVVGNRDDVSVVIEDGEIVEKGE